jgi:CDP-6-deoxy-D-xylo-4-hexulose-3-dehydrase
LQEQFAARSFVAGESVVPVSGSVLNGADLRNLLDAAMDCWLTTGRFAKEFERRLPATSGYADALW